jgi:DNA-binding LacI/PurR family transcriptional regulator
MVAERAGLSIATVSLVLNGKTQGRVSSASIDRVRAAVDELGYVIDQGASALARGRSDLVVLIAPDLSNPFFGAVVRGIEAELGDRFQLMLSVTESGVQPAAADLRRFAGLRPAGLLVDAPSNAFLDEIDGDEPIVLLDAPQVEHPVETVNYDMADAIEELLAHLAHQGHTTVAYFDSTTGTTTFDLRRGTVAAAAERHGIAVAPSDDLRSVIDMQAAAYAFSAAWPALHAGGVTAVICATDTHAYGVLEAAGSLRIRVPDDLAVTGFDDLPYSRVTSPSLTTIRLPGEPLGRAAARRLIRRIDDADTTDVSAATFADIHADVPPLVATLVIRGSTA